MGVVERLSLEAASADTLIACHHVHRYKMAAELCAGLRVVDLACGSGYGSAILRETATRVMGVDSDAATIDTARATVGAATDVTFEVADAVEYLSRGLQKDWDAVVCLEGIEHFPELDRAVNALSTLASEGVKLVISVPNSQTFSEENEFHVTDFSFQKAMELFEGLGETTVLYQFVAEGSLVRGDPLTPLQAESVLDDYGEADYANHFIGCVNFRDGIETGLNTARMRLAVAPAYNRHMLALERANKELWRENERLARGRLGQSDAAAAATIFRLQRDLRERAEHAEAEAERLRQLLAMPRHVAVERARDAALRSRLVYGAVRLLWGPLRPK